MFDPNVHHQRLMMHPASRMMNPQTRIQQVHQEQQMHDIQVGINDVMCGRGGGTNNHIGNIRFRQLVNGHKLRYLAATKSEKPMVSKEVVTIWKGLRPPGRFLMQEKKKSDNGTTVMTGKWYDIGDKKAREKASQCLRERTPEVMPFVKKLDLQLQYQQEAESGNGSNEQNRKNAEILSNELIQEQQQAAVIAHQALNAYLPMSSQACNGIPHNQSVMPVPYGSETQMYHSIPPAHAAARPAVMKSMSSMPLPATVHSLPSSSSGQQERRRSSKQLTDQIEREIEELQQAQAKLEAEAKAAEVEFSKAMGTGIYSVANVFNECALKAVPANSNSADLPAKQLTKEEYCKSVKEFLGASSSYLSSNGSISRHSDKKVVKRERQDESFDRIEQIKPLSRESWVQSFNANGDDASMGSTPRSSGSSNIKMLNEDLEPLDIREGILSENVKISDKSLGKASLSTFESQIIENLISPANIDTFEQSMPALPNIKEDKITMPSPKSGMAPPSAVSHTAMHSRPSQFHINPSSNATSFLDTCNQHSARGTFRPHHGVQKQKSTNSMLSDLSEYSQKAIGMSSKHRMESITKMKADPTIFTDNLSDLSNAMESLDMITNKSFKE